MGQTTKKMCHTQEIAFEPTQDEWRPVDEWDEDVTPGQNCEVPSNCRLCCRPGDQHVEEVLVVHHEALQKVNFLLKHDELSSCESPTVPECVAAVWRSKIQKRLLVQHRTPAPCDVLPIETSSPRRRRENSGLDSEESSDNEASDEDGPRQFRFPDDFNQDEQLSVVDRLSTGLQMWLLMRGSEGKMVEEEVVIHWSAAEPSTLIIVGQHICTTLPLANLRCMEVAMDNAVKAADVVPPPRGMEDRETYVYLQMDDGSVSTSQSSCHLAFHSTRDAHEFKDWMRALNASHVTPSTETSIAV